VTIPIAKGEPGNVYRPDCVPTYALYPARSGPLFEFQESMALPVIGEDGGGEMTVGVWKAEPQMAVKGEGS